MIASPATRLRLLAVSARGMVDALSLPLGTRVVWLAERTLVSAAMLCPRGSVGLLEGFTVGELCMLRSTVDSPNAMRRAA